MTDLIELRRLLDEATPTPWELAFRDPAMNGEHWVTRQVGRPGVCIAGFSYGHASGDPYLATAAVNALPELLAAAEALERVEALHRPVEVEPSESICAACSTRRGTGENVRYFPYTEWPCPTIRALGDQ